MKNIDIQKENYGLEVCDNEVSYRLGNWTTAGWHWDGNEYDTLTFLNRLYNSTLWKAFKKDLKAHGVDDSYDFFYPLLVESINNDDFYSIAGDNSYWYYNSWSDEIYTKISLALYDKDIFFDDLNETEQNRVDEIAYKVNPDYDDFISWLSESVDLKKDLLKMLDESKTIDEFMNEAQGYSNIIFESILEYIDRLIYDKINEKGV